jgi:hypothetical protein
MTSDLTAPNTLNLTDATSYKVMLLPLALPIPFKIDDTTKGTTTESTIDILDTTIDGGAFWAKCILSYDQAQSDELARLSIDTLARLITASSSPSSKRGRPGSLHLSAKSPASAMTRKTKPRWSSTRLPHISPRSLNSPVVPLLQ